MQEEINGTVKWYNPTKAYGFIATEDGQDVFVHRTAIYGGADLQEGQPVTVVVRTGAKGLEAESVAVAGEAPVSARGASRSSGYASGGGYGSSYSGSSYDSGGGYGSRATSAPRREREPYRGTLPSGATKATVQRIDPAGRFLFARLNELGVDVFVHNSLFQFARPAVREGDTVWLTVENSERGPRANSLEQE